MVRGEAGIRKRSPIAYDCLLHPRHFGSLRRADLTVNSPGRHYEPEYGQRHEGRQVQSHPDVPQRRPVNEERREEERQGCEDDQSNAQAESGERLDRTKVEEIDFHIARPDSPESQYYPESEIHGGPKDEPEDGRVGKNQRVYHVERWAPDQLPESRPESRKHPDGEGESYDGRDDARSWSVVRNPADDSLVHLRASAEDGTQVREVSHRPDHHEVRRPEHVCDHQVDLENPAGKVPVDGESAG